MPKAVTPASPAFRLKALPAMLAALALMTPHGASQAGATLYAFGAAVGDSKVPVCDDCSQLQSLVGQGPAGSTLSFNFFAKSYTSLFVNNNGAISMNAGVSAYTGLPFPYSDNPLIAPYWADVDTRAANAGTVWYRTAQDSALLREVSTEIQGSFMGATSFNATFAEVVTWDRVGYYNQRADKLNTFQAVIASDGMRTFAIFKYPTGGINWARGDASPVGSYAQVGFDAGDRINYYNGVGSRTAQTLNLPELSNTVPASPGTQVYRIDSAVITTSSSLSGSGVSQVVGAAFPMSGELTWARLDPAMAWTPVSTTWTQQSSANLTQAGKWLNGRSARFAGVVSGTSRVGEAVKVSGALAAQRVTIEADGYSFGSTAVGDSLQLSNLVVPSATTQVTFKGDLVVLTHVDDAGLRWNGQAWVQGGVLTQGRLTFADASTLVARDVGAVRGVGITLQDNARLMLYSSDATTRDTTLNFEKTQRQQLGLNGAPTGIWIDHYPAAVGGTVDLRGFSTTVGQVSAARAGVGRITNSGTTLSRLTVDFDDDTATFSGGVVDGTGAVALAKAGSGTWVLNGTNAYTGGVTLRGGALELGSTSALGSGGPISFEGGVLRYAVDGVPDASARFSSAAGQRYAVDTQGAMVTWAGNLNSSGGSLLKLGASTLTLTGTNTYSGGTTVLDGVVAFARSSSLGTGAVKLDGGMLRNLSQAVINLGVTLGANGGGINASGGNLLIQGDTVGTGALNKWGAYTLTLGGTARHTGTTTVHVGELKFSNTSTKVRTVATSSIDLADWTQVTFAGSHAVAANVSGAGKLVQEGGTTTLTGQATHRGGTTITAGGLNVGNGGTSGSLGGAVANSGTLTFNRSDSTRFDGSISGSGAVVQAGSGRLVLAGTHSYTGATRVDAGELVLQGSVASSAVTVKAGARLSGVGQMGALSLAGTLNPGESPGLLQAGNTTFLGGASYVWEIQDAQGVAGVGYDSLSVTGSLDWAASAAAPFTVSLRSLTAAGLAGDLSGFDASIGHRYTLVSTTLGIRNFSANSLALSTAGFTNDLRGGSWSVEQRGLNLDLVFTAAAPVPEPETWALVGAGVVVVAAARRRRAARQG